MAGTTYQIGVEIDARGGTRAAAELGKAESALNRFGQSGRAALTSFSGNLAADAIGQITSLAIEGGKAILAYSSKLEQTKIGFESLLGSGEKASVLLKQIQDFAKSTPFEFQGIAALSQRLLGANVEAQKIIPLMRDIGNVVAATGETSQERLEGVSTAISQIIGKNKFSAEEAEQLAERGISAFQILSQATGKSQAELRKLSEQGAISADFFLKALSKVSQEKFGDAMEKQSKTFSGAMSNIKDSVMIASSTAFQPLYTEISKLAVGLSKEIEAQGGDLNAVGEIIGKYIVAGITFALAEGGKGAVSYLISNIKSQFTDERPETFAPLKLTEILIEGAAKGFGYNIDVFGKNTSKAVQTSIADLRKADDTISKISSSVLKMPSVAKNLEADKAKKETDLLVGTIRDLSIQIEFFGDDSTVAATKQKLLSQGITDFNSGLAKTALTAAAYLDKLKAGQKEQDEYNRRLKSATDYMRDLREEADFKLNFPKANQADEFNRWVQKNTIGLRGLQTEVDLTREKIQKLLFSESFKERQDGNEIFNRSVKQALEDFKGTADDFEGRYKQLVKNLVEPLGIKDADKFAENLFGRFPQWSAEVDQVSKDVDLLIEKGIIEKAERAKKIEEGIQQVHKEQQERMRVWLDTFKKDAGGTPINIFGISTDEFEFVDKFIRLYNGLANSMKSEQLKTGTETLDEVLKDLNLTFKDSSGSIVGAKTAMQEFDELLGSPQTQAAIIEYAKRIGMTADEFERLVRAKKEAQLDPGKFGVEGGGTAGDKKSPLADGLFGTIGIQKIQTEAEMVEGVYTKLGQTAGEAINGLAQGMGQLVENWVLYGDLSGENARKAIASALAMAAAQSAVSAIMETAYGIAALTPWGAAIYGPASFHFKAAALFATVAAGTALAGRAVAGNSFKGGGNDSSQNQPDYYSENPNGNLRAFNGAIRTDNRNPNILSPVNALARAVEKLESRISSARPGDILTAGAAQKPGFISQIATTELVKNPTQITKMQRALNMK